MTAIQATLGQFAASTRKPIIWWLHRLQAMPPIPFARREPIVEVEPSPYYEGSEVIRAFWYCSLPWALAHPRYDPCLRVMAPIYDLARDMIADGWIVEACDIKPWRDQKVDVRLVAYRWISEAVLSDEYLYALANPLGREAVSVRCSSHFPSEAIV
jgi:hypothetical protein